MADYEDTADRLAKVIGNAQGKSSGRFDDIEHLTIDQQLKVCEISALLSVAQELSSLNPQNLKQRGDDGGWYDGWGNKLPNQK